MKIDEIDHISGQVAASVLRYKQSDSEQHVSGDIKTSQSIEIFSIICVDDEDSVLRSLKRQLRSQPYKVITTTSPKEALEILRSSEDNIGLILSDYCMPEMNGAVFLNQAMGIKPETPRMILSGHADTKATMDAINQGEAFRFLTKPWNEGELEVAINEGLHRYKLIQENRRLGILTEKQLEEFYLWMNSMKQRVLQQTSLIREKMTVEKRYLALLKKNTASVVTMLSKVIAARSQRLFEHSQNVSKISLAMSISLNLSEEQQEITRIAGLLHDFGKVCLPDVMLSKPDNVLPAVSNKNDVNSHTLECVDILLQYEGWGDIAETILQASNYITNAGTGTDSMTINNTKQETTIRSKIIALANWSENSFNKDTSHSPKYTLSKKIKNEMPSIFGIDIINAATNAIMSVLPENDRAFNGVTDSAIPANMLKDGMILSKNYYGNNGIVLVGKGIMLSAKTIEVIHKHIGSARLNKTSVFIEIKSLPEDMDRSLFD